MELGKWKEKGGGWTEPQKPFVEGVWMFLEQHSVRDKKFVMLWNFFVEISYISVMRV